MITRRQLETRRQDPTSGALPARHTARNMSWGLCACAPARISCRRERQREEGHARGVHVLAMGGRLGVTMNATVGREEVTVVDARSY